MYAFSAIFCKNTTFLSQIKMLIYETLGFLSMTANVLQLHAGGAF
jgi:hypothetical protein